MIKFVESECRNPHIQLNLGITIPKLTIFPGHLSESSPGTYPEGHSDQGMKYDFPYGLRGAGR